MAGFFNPNAWGEAWNFKGKASDFIATPNGIPFFPGGGISGLTAQQNQQAGYTPTSPTLNSACNAAAAAMGTLALASLWNSGCYANGSSILIPPPYGQTGTIPRNIFHNPNFRTWDFSVTKAFKIKEQITAQFRADFFNVLNHPSFRAGGCGTLGQQRPINGHPWCSLANQTPDAAAGSPILGSGGARNIQLGLKLIF